MLGTRPRAGHDVAIVAATAVLAALALADLGIGARGLIAAFFLGVLVVLSAVDIEQRILPNRIIFPSAIAVLVAQLAFFPDQALEWTLAPLAAAGFLFLLAAVYPAGLGMGDVKLMLLVGAALGKSVGLVLVVGFVAASLYSLVLLARHGSSARKMGFPFGPFLALGAVVSVFASDSLF